MSRFDRTIKSFSGTIKNSNQRKTSPFDATAEVLRVEGNTAWVHIPGGVDETPVRLTVNAKAGDTVQVRVGGGRAWITGNATAPPTDDTKAEQAVKSVGVIKKVVNTVRDLAEKTAKIAGNTNQYFWHTESGTDTGAHITEIPKDDFLEDPTNGGGNLLARSNGIAVRDGLTELGTFAADGIAFNNDNGTNVFEIVTEETQSIIEKSMLDIHLTSSSRTGSYSRTLTYPISELQYIQIWYRHKSTYTGGVSYFYLTPTRTSQTLDFATAQYTQSNKTISISFTQDGTAGAELMLYEIRIQYKTTLDGISKVRSGIFPSKSALGIFEVGNGTSAENRSNAFFIDFFGNTSPSMDFAMMTAENQVITQAVDKEVKINRIMANGDCFKVFANSDGYSMIQIKKRGYYQILVSSLWSAVSDASKVRVVLASNALGAQYGFAYAMGRVNTWDKRMGMDIVFIDVNEFVRMWARDEGNSGSTLRSGQIIIRPVLLD